MDLHTFVSRIAIAIVISASVPAAGCTTPMPLTTQDAAVAVDGAVVPVDTGTDASCTPHACTPDECGVIADGCGSTVECGACACTPATMATDCPSRPCEVAVGCDAGECRYEPVTCDFVRCECPDAGCADDTTPRSCGTGCAATVCDPRPTDVAGRIVYANACVPREEVRCGLCGLGGYACGADGALSCEAPAFHWIDPATAECEGSSALSSVVYVDVVASDGNGSREHPFQTLAQGMAAAILRGARLVVIGRSPRIDGTLHVASGISILGGYTGWPTWRRDDTERPVLHASASDAHDGRLVGLEALAIHERTRVEHVRVETEDLLVADGTSNAGIWANDAPALELVDIELSVGRAADGAAGADGVPPTVSLMSGTAAGVGSYTGPAGCSQTVVGASSAIVVCDGTARAYAAGGAGGTSTAPPVGTGRIYPGVDAASGALGGLGDGTTRHDAQSGASIGMPPYASAGLYGYALRDGFPVPTGAGGNGLDGADGNGGGGGASGRRFHVLNAADMLTCTIGGGGGAGGSGGCGGSGGRGGQSGGWIFALVITESSGIVIDSVVASIRYGGEGGAGGLGSSGTPGYPGSPGGTAVGLPATWEGRPGAAGSAGQRGADGGRGAGGGARGVLCDAAIDVTGVSVTSDAVDFIATEGCS